MCSLHSAQSASDSQSTDMVGHRFQKESADHLTNQFKKHLEQHPRIDGNVGPLVYEGYSRRTAEKNENLSLVLTDSGLPVCEKKSC